MSTWWTYRRAVLRSLFLALMMLVTAASATAEIGCTMTGMTAPMAVNGDRPSGPAVNDAVLADENGVPVDQGTVDCALNCVQLGVAAPASPALDPVSALSAQPRQSAAYPPLRATEPPRTERPPQA